MCKKLTVLMALIFALGTTANAALYLWNGSAGDGLWETPGNWTVTDSVWAWPNEENSTDPNRLDHVNGDTLAIDILDGSVVTRNGGLGIEGAEDGSTTAVLTINNASTLITSGHLATGTDPNEKGQIDILGGSSVDVGNGMDILIADEPGSWGMLNIVDSTITIADDLRTDNGEGHISISGNSIVNCDDLVIADPEDGLGSLDVSGTATITVVDDIRIDQGNGQITIGGDAIVNWGDDFKVADAATGVGSLVVSGNAVLNGGDDLMTDDGEGHITITDNAIVDVDDLFIVDNPSGVGSLEVSGNAMLDLDDFKIVDDPGSTGSLHVSGNAIIYCDDFYGNDDGGDPSSITITLDGGSVIVGDDTTFNDDNPGTAIITLNGGSWLGNDRINVSDNLNSTVHVTINDGEMICNALRLGEGGGDDVGQIRFFLNGGLLQANTLDIQITDSQIIYTGGLLRLGSADVNEADMQQMITDGTIVAEGVHSIVTDGDYTVLNPLPPTVAKVPYPADGAEGVLLGSTLSWVPGETAATHDVYFGTANPPAFVRNQEAASYYPGPIEVGTTYYWKIDEVEADGTTKYAGNVWSFTATTDLSTVSEIATQPSPVDGAAGIPLEITLGWWPGASAVSHDVYFGTTSPPALLSNTTGFSFDPGPLEKGATYYWRIDAVEANGTVHTGDTWSFATVLDIPITDPNLIVWWTFDEDAGTTVIDHSGHNHYGTVNGTTWVADGKVGGAMDFSGGGDDVVDPDASYLNGLSAITFAVWVKSDVTNTDKGFIICEDPEGNDSHDMRYDSAGATAGGTDLLKMAVTSTGGEQQIESSSGLQTTEWQHYVMVWSSGEQLKFYVNGVLDTPMANSDATTGTTTGYTKLIAGKGKDGSSSAGWDGLIDDLRVYDIALSEPEIAVLAGLVVAWSPDPADGATEVLPSPTLSWKAGGTAASHDVYFGTSDPPAFIHNQTETTYSPGNLSKSTTYYWRVDEVEADGTTKHTGNVWSFTVTSAGR